MSPRDIQDILAAKRLTVRDICTLCRASVGRAGEPTREAIYALSLSADRLTAYHALQVLTHLDSFDIGWLESKRALLAGRALTETDTGLLRLTLALLLRLKWGHEEPRADLIDFCLERITRTFLPCAIRAQCMKLACKQMTPFPELTEELACTLLMLEQEALSPGLESARRQAWASIETARRKHDKRAGMHAQD